MWKLCGVEKAGHWTPVYVELRVPKEAGRLVANYGDKCRAEYATVMSITDKAGNSYPSCRSVVHTRAFTYTRGQVVRPDSYDSDPQNDCSSGIHCYLYKDQCDEWLSCVPTAPSPVTP